MRYSLLDLAPVPEGSEIPQSFANSTDLAQQAEGWGYHRYWLAEHHNMPGIASAATAVLIGHISSQTNTIRVGAGGIMLPNHAPYMVAEAFGTLAALYGDRIDLGLGRAPGTDMQTARALRRGMAPGHASGDSFPQDVIDLIGFLGPIDPDAKVRAFPGQNSNVPVWILGSSLYGAQLAAQLGLPYAFASHFAPQALEEALEVYRRAFRPSAYLDQPHAMMAVNVFGAETDAEGIRLRTTMQQAFARLRLGQPGKLPRPVDDITQHLSPPVLAGVNEALTISATGSPETVKQELSQIIMRYAPDEVIITGQIHDHAARLRSFEIAAAALKSL
ncbi:Alkanal monooxygenase alpha chain [Phaeobacter sp. CECT 5382]|uniref:LLM class flavin-dependent oxidoreductase n=1 Tax=Phaeobacter sp. CECT 5382 TaxID=1712645 RepID=UPI0006D9DED1|nr:LLM class flavin-dependent oxidoreductase [Phaeobacter sp. CECT 5382]CUH88604.1 Alkanal monooxygenase alpha chain [Phaeobacter sp. CECT 5382]